MQNHWTRPTRKFRGITSPFASPRCERIFKFEHLKWVQIYRGIRDAEYLLTHYTYLVHNYDTFRRLGFSKLMDKRVHYPNIIRVYYTRGETAKF